ncbi:ankyrin repeat-containing protein [Trifolium medium]|uniref:Ankyrin repeat-containing protein n=1 Tax=Trifolium medium TaxID=97028 RepID=A0A392LZG0_9FABA|nr:ankyrin repeat-containing protein [Trifolium medium]
MYKQAKNGDGLKPRELFSKNHELLLNEARQSVKETASSFTIVGTLIVAIMFAAAFTVPGGNDQNKGTPLFLGQNAFSVFIIADTFSLVASSQAVLTFTGILASNYTEEDFIKTLPAKLLTGICTIFISLVCMMCAFCAAIALMLKGYNSIMVTAIAFSVLPIYDIFGTTDLVKEFFFLGTASEVLGALADITSSKTANLIALLEKYY